MLQEVERKAAEFFRCLPEFGNSESLLVAVSGGADSTALVSVVKKMQENGLFSGRVICVHINHQLRGADADADEQFVADLSVRFGFESVIRRVDVKGYADEKRLSIETAARQLRIEVLLETALRYGCKWIATAHQKNDNAETVLHRLARGTGFRGLCGIFGVKRFGDGVLFVRPLLEVTRREIESYLGENQLQWRTDKTNSQFIYTRNIIRHRVLPNLQKDSSDPLVEILARLASSSRSLHERLCPIVDSLWDRYVKVNENDITIFTEKLFLYLPCVWVEVFRKALIFLGCGERGLKENHYNAIFGLAKNKNSGRVIDLPGGFSVLYQYETFVFFRKQNQVEQRLNTEAVRLNVPGEVKFGSYFVVSELLRLKKGQISDFKKDKDCFLEWFDADKIVGGLEIRLARRGDHFVPLGQKSSKKVARFLSVGKVVKDRRKESFVVSDDEKIIWLAPVRISDEAKIGSMTKKVVQIRIKNEFVCS